MDEQFFEQLKTINNLVKIATILYNLGMNELLPTVAELILIEAQDMVESYCIKKE